MATKIANTTAVCVLLGSIIFGILSILTADPSKNTYLNDLYGLMLVITIPLLVVSVFTNFDAKVINFSLFWIMFQSILVLFGSYIFNGSYLENGVSYSHILSFIFSINNTIETTAAVLVVIFYLSTILISAYILFSNLSFRNIDKSILLTAFSSKVINLHKMYRICRSKPSTYITKRIVVSSILMVMMTSGTILPFLTSSLSSANAAEDAKSSSDSNSDSIPGSQKPTEENPFPLSIISPNSDIRQKCLDEQLLPSDKIRKFNIHAISVDIVYNSFGQVDPNGAMYVLEEDKSRIEKEVRKNPHKTVTDVQPLVIRSHFGECIEIKFTNDLKDEYASIHTYGVGIDPNKSDGMAVGVNKDTTVAPGKSITYRWFPDREGSYFFTDGAREINRLTDVDGVINSVAQKHIHNPTDLSILGEWQNEIKLDRNNNDNNILGEWQKETSLQNGKNSRNNNNNNNQQEEELDDNNVLPSLRQRGLFGSLIVEPPGAIWTHPITGKPINSGVRADIQFSDPVRPDAREFILFYHDGPEVVNKDGSELIDLEGEPYDLFPINYRGDPIPERFDPDNCPPGVEEEVCLEEGFFYSSWVHGDPGGGDLIFPAYRGDPLRFFVIGANQVENHVHHLHHHRWKAQTEFPPFETIDSNTVNPGKTFFQPTVAAFGDGSVRPSMTFTQALVAGGAGYTVNDFGDVLFHCHLFPHYGLGMWGIVRVLDKINSVHFERTSDGELKPAGDILQELPDRKSETPKPTQDQSGFPFFIPTNDDGSPKLPPDPNGVGRDYTEVEWKATNYFKENPNSKIGEGAAPGAPITNPCPPDAKVRHYDVTALQDKIMYNRYGDNDPFGRFYVIEQEKQKVLANKDNLEPLLLRGNLGDCIEVTFKNEIPEGFKLPTKDQPEEEVTSMSMHIHFVAFDLQGSDGVATGYNYQSFIKPDEKISYRWYLDEEGNIFWHDHASGIERGMHGTFGETVVEPKDSKWLHPVTGKPTITSHEAIIAPEDGKSFKSFREFAMVYQDFTELFDKKGTPINFQARDNNGKGDVVNPKLPEWGSFEDHGVMAINYKNEPLYHRIENAKNDDTKDPAYLFSSWTHGDPSTPVFKAYSNDPIKIRLVTGAHEEQHNLVLHGLFPDPGPEGRGVIAQTIGISEQFTFDVTPENVMFDMIPPEMVNTQSGETITLNAISPRNDYLYSSHASDDTWNGMWGIIRVWCDPGAANSDGVKLFPLPGVKQTNCSEDTNIKSTVNTDDLIKQQPDNNNNVNDDDVNTKFDNRLEEKKFTGSGGDDRNNGFSNVGDDNNDNKLIDNRGTILGGSSTTDKLTNDRGTILGGTSDVFEMEREKDGKLKDKPDLAKAKETMFDDQTRKKPKPMGITPPLELADLLAEKGSNKLETYVNSRCPDDARITSFDVTAFTKDIKYNRYGDHDPFGIVYALNEDVQKIKEGKKSLEPLVLRANMGDCIVVKLTNSLPESYGNNNDGHNNHRHPLMPVECSEHLKVACFEPKDYPTSNRVSMHPQIVNYDINLFDGTNVGFNPLDQTIGPGETTFYVWFADRPGTAVLTDMADLRGHRHHGAYASLAIGAEGASYFDPETSKPIKSGAVADVVINNDDVKNLEYREFSVLMADGKYIVNPTDLCIIPIEEEDPDGTACNQSPVNDPEEQGFVSINYKSAPFLWRLLLEGFYQTSDEKERSKIIAQLFSSKVHGDPDTPIFKAKEGTPVVFRVSDVADKPKGFTLHIPGHHFVRAINTETDVSEILGMNLADLNEPIVVEHGATVPLSPGRSTNLVLVGGAGGLQDKPGDYIYQETKIDKFLEAGPWGIFRVEDSNKKNNGNNDDRKDKNNRDKNLLPEIKAEIRDIANNIKNALAEQQQQEREQEKLQILEAERNNRLLSDFASPSYSTLYSTNLPPPPHIPPSYSSPHSPPVYNDDSYITRDKEFNYDMN
jgi:FtsP/CotA-like multicopper oxidase with cupredoxin domain